MPKKNVPARRQANDVPDFFRTANDMGTESIDSTDISIPRIKICQGVSGVHDEIKIVDGDIYESISKTIFEKPLNVVVVLHWKSTVWFSEDNKMLATMFIHPITKEEIWFGQDADHIRSSAKLLENGMQSHNYFLLPREALREAVSNGDFPLPYAFSCTSAAIKSARNLNGRLRMNGGKGIPIFGQEVTIDTKKEKFTKGSAFMPVFGFGGFVTKDEFEFLKGYHVECKKLQQKAVASSENDEDISFPNEEDEEIPEPKTKKTAKKKAGMF